MAIPRHNTYLDFADVVLGDSRMRRSPKPFNAIFFDQKTLEEVYDPECCTAAGVEAFAELLVRHLFNPDAKTVITIGASREIVNRIVEIVQSNENLPNAWNKISQKIHDIEHSDFDWLSYRDSIERRLEYLFRADGFIPVCIEGCDATAYFIPFQFVTRAATDARDSVAIYSLDDELLDNSSWEDELKLLPVRITEDIQLGISTEKTATWCFRGSSLLLPITLAWWRKTGMLHRYNRFRVMATGRFDKNKRLREVDVPAKERAFALGVKGGRLIRPGNGGTACEISVGASVDEVLDRVRTITYHTASSMFNALESRWRDPVSSYKNITGIGSRVIERILALRNNAWCAVIDSPAFKKEERISDVGLYFLKTILGFSNSAAGGCVLISIPEGKTQKEVLLAAEDILRDVENGLVDVNGHHWRFQIDAFDGSKTLINNIKSHPSYGPMGEILALTVEPSRSPCVLYRECSALCLDGGTIPLTCMSICRRTDADNPNGEWTIPELLKNWGNDGVVTQMDVLGDVLDEDERMFDGGLFAPVERIRQQGWSLGSEIWSEFSAVSCLRAQSRVLGSGNERRLFLLESEDDSEETLRRLAAEILLNDLRLHKWGTPVPVVIQVNQDDVDNWGLSELLTEELLIQLLQRNYPAGEFPVCVWKQLIDKRLLTLVVFGDKVEVAVDPTVKRSIQKMTQHLLCVVGNDILWVGNVPNEVKNCCVCLDAHILRRIYKGGKNDTDNHP